MFFGGVSVRRADEGQIAEKENIIVEPLLSPRCVAYINFSFYFLSISEKLVLSPILHRKKLKDSSFQEPLKVTQLPICSWNL